MHPARSRLRRLRSALFIGAVFLSWAVFFWWRLPPSPRFTLGGDVRYRLLDVSPDGALLAVVANAQEIQLRRVATGEPCGEFPVQGVEHALFTADSQRLVANCFGKEGHVGRIYRVDTRQVEAVLPLGGSDSTQFFRQPRSFRLSPDAKSIAYVCPKEGREKNSAECQLKVWDVASAQEKAVLQASVDVVTHMPLAFSPDGRFLAGGIHRSKSNPHEVKVWDVTTGQVQHTFAVPPLKGNSPGSQPLNIAVDALSFTPDGHQLIGVVEGQLSGYLPQLLCWDLMAGSLPKSLESKELRFMDAGTIEFQFAGAGSRVLLASRSPLGNLAHLCDMSGPEPRLQASFADVPLLTHDGTRLGMNNRPSGALSLFASIARPGENPAKERPKVQLVDLATMQRRDLIELSGVDGFLTPLAFAPDDRSLAVHCLQLPSQERVYKPLLMFLLEPDRAVHLYDIDSGRRLARLPGAEARFTPDGRTLITSELKSPARTDGVAALPSSMAGGVWVYDSPHRLPVLAILASAAGATAAVTLLLWVCRAWRSRRQPKLSDKPL